jgi:outer membrane receptor protein involved in Fe transport
VLIGTAATAEVALAPGTTLETVTVTAQRLERARNALSPTTGSSQYVFDQKTIDKLPEGDHTPFNRLLLQAPGVANDSYGQLHVRGDHNDLQYRINGVILPEGVSGFGQVLDTRFAKSITLNAGALPAQYGLRTAGVIDIVTKDRLEGGDIDLYGGSHGTFNPSFQLANTSGPFSAYITGQYLTSNLGVENPTDKSNAIHDATQQGKGFGYFSYLLDSHTKLSAIVASTYTRLEIPNNPGQDPNVDFVNQLNNAGFDTSNISSAGLNEHQFERNLYGLLALQGVLANGANYQLAVFDRQSSVQFKPDVLGDLAFNGVAAEIRRKATTLGLQGDVGYALTESHTLTAGFSASTENDKADNSSQLFTTDGSGAVNGGPVTIVDNNPKNDNTLASVYLQDKWEATQSLTINYGLRYDKLDAFVSGSQLSPRLGLVDLLTPRTTLHAGYARYFTPPPNELVANTSLAAFANTTNAPATTINSSVKPERSHYFDAGVVHQLTSSINVGVDAYYREVRNLLDEGQFGQALIFTPFNYDQGHIYGVELTSAYHQGNLSAYLNVSRASAKATKVVSGEFNFGQDDLNYISNHYVYLDHDQRVTVSGGSSYKWYGTTYGIAGTYGTGLRKDLVNADTGATVPNGAKVTSNLQFDLSAARSVNLGAGLGTIDLRLAALNVLDHRNEIRDGSGIGVGAPQFGPRAALYFGIAKSFGRL